jgi:hypothetical protein
MPSSSISSASGSTRAVMCAVVTLAPGSEAAQTETADQASRSQQLVHRGQYLVDVGEVLAAREHGGEVDGDLGAEPLARGSCSLARSIPGCRRRREPCAYAGPAHC